MPLSLSRESAYLCMCVRVKAGERDRARERTAAFGRAAQTDGEARWRGPGGQVRAGEQGAGRVVQTGRGDAVAGPDHKSKITI